MTNIPDTQATAAVPTYAGRGEPAGRFADYHPAWMDKLAPDVTLEGSLLDGAVNLVTFNAEGQAQHISANYRPLSSVMAFSRLMHERLAGSPNAERFLADEV